MDKNSTKIWERLPSETDKAFNAFSEFLLMPIKDPNDPTNNRTHLNLSRRMGYPNTNKPATSIEGWSSKFNWSERLRAYDTYMANHSITVVETGLEEYQQGVIFQRGQQLAAMNEVIEKKISVMREELEAGGDVEALAISRVMSSLRVLDDLARRVGKMPTAFTTEKVEEETDDDRVFLIGGD